VNQVAAATRRYARRQLTWLSKLRDAVIIDVQGEDPGDVAREILSIPSPSTTRRSRARREIRQMAGLGNDYLIVDDTAMPVELSRAAVGLICDRHLGWVPMASSCFAGQVERSRARWPACGSSIPT